MKSVAEWKHRIIKILINRGTYTTSYKILSHPSFIASFGDALDTTSQKAYEELLKSKIIEEYNSNNKIYYSLNFAERTEEIEQILKNEPIDEKSDLIIPQEELIGLKERFRDASSRGWPNRGFYYHCTDSSDINFWITLIKTRPAIKPYKIILGSTQDKKSRIMRIWKGVVKVSKTNNGEPFIRKWVENIEQEACGNNRLPSRCAFSIFVYLGWLDIVKIKGQSKFYKINKDLAID